MAAWTFKFLMAVQVQRLHARYISPNSVPIQPDMLESAIHSPMNLKHYTEQEDIFQLAANLSEKIMKNHAFQDGNKRTALVAADMFLKINSYWLQNVPLAEDTNNKALADAHAAVIANNWNAQQLASFYKSVASEYKDGATEYLECVMDFGSRRFCHTRIISMKRGDKYKFG
jgi:death-on-curing family protein